MLENPIMMIILLTIVVIPFYGYFLYIFSRRFARGKVGRKFFHAVVSILENNPNERDCIEQLDINFRKLRERYPTASSDVKSTVDLLEDMLHYYDTLGGKGVKTRFNLEVTSSIRSKLAIIINEMKSQNPFVSLSREDANLLADLKHSIETGNTELGIRTLRQIAEEIKIKESNMRIRERKSTTSNIIAVIGAILTLFFGLLSFVKFL